MQSTAKVRKVRSSTTNLIFSRVVLELDVNGIISNLFAYGLEIDLALRRVHRWRSAGTSRWPKRLSRLARSVSLARDYRGAHAQNWVRLLPPRRLAQNPIITSLLKSYWTHLLQVRAWLLSRRDVGAPSVMSCPHATAQQFQGFPTSPFFPWKLSFTRFSWDHTLRGTLFPLLQVAFFVCYLRLSV